MKLPGTALAAALAAAILTPCVALGAGYGIYEQGAAVLGMAGAGTASVHDASALFFNPASIVRLDGRQAYFGGTWLSTRISFAGVDPAPGFGVTEAMKNGNFFPPTVYWTNHLGPRWAYGVGLDTPFGLGVEWLDPEQFTGRSIVTKATLKTLNGNFSLSYAPGNTFSLGAGFDALFAAVELNSIQQEIIPGGGGAMANVAHVQLKSGYKPGYAFNAGMLWQPKSEWKFGLTYRAKIEAKIDDGDATFTQIPTGDTLFDAQVRANLPPAQTVKTTLKFPSIFSAGIAWNPAADWTWEADFGWAAWSAFDQLDLDFPTTPSLTRSIIENYKDSFRASFGAEHRLPGYTYRFGYYFDQAAAPTESVSPLLPDTNRHGFTLGLGWQLGDKKQWGLDVYDLALFGENRSTERMNRDGYDGTYKAFVNATGLSLAYHW